MNENILVAVLLTLLASSGFWAFVIAMIEKKSARNRMLLGLGHDRIVFLCMKYVEKGEITQGEYENLNKYLYEPYKKMGGNGTAERLMQEVCRPVRPCRSSGSKQSKMMPKALVTKRPRAVPTRAEST